MMFDCDCDVCVARLDCETSLSFIHNYWNPKRNNYDWGSKMLFFFSSCKYTYYKLFFRATTLFCYCCSLPRYTMYNLVSLLSVHQKIEIWNKFVYFPLQKLSCSLTYAHNACKSAFLITTFSLYNFLEICFSWARTTCQYNIELYSVLSSHVFILRARALSSMVFLG